VEGAQESWRVAEHLLGEFGRYLVLRLSRAGDQDGRLSFSGAVNILGCRIDRVEKIRRRRLHSTYSPRM
jgi:hypothetical protein